MKEGGERGRARVGGHRVEGGEWGGGGWKCPTGIASQAFLFGPVCDRGETENFRSKSMQILQYCIPKQLV